MYEEQVEGNEEKQIAYITVGDQTVGTHVEVKNTAYNVESDAYHEASYNRYFHTDALGSITAVTDDSGKVVERRSYEAFGKIRAMDYGVNNNTQANLTIETARSFTGHEQIGEIEGLVHMNARIYDSDIGRFLSADTIVQDIYDTQAFNPYSYVRNNPLKYTDPSGHSFLGDLWDKWLKPALAIVAAVVVAIYAPQFLSTYMGIAEGSMASVVATGAMAGAASGAVMTGTIEGTLKGAMFGALSAGTAFTIGHGGGLFETVRQYGGSVGKAALHGISRAAIAKLQNTSAKGSFLSGFAASLLGGTLSNVKTSFTTVKVTIAAIAGGTASVIGGGKFSNGAMGGAFIMLFNDLKGTLFNKARDGAVGSLAKKELDKANVNSSMGNVLKRGAVGFVGGAFAGTAYAGFPYGTATGAVLGTAGGLTTGAAMESFGANQAIDNTITGTLEVVEELRQGFVNTYAYIRCGYGGCEQ